jgi:hypothetical protein
VWQYSCPTAAAAGHRTDEVSPSLRTLVLGFLGALVAHGEYFLEYLVGDGFIDLLVGQCVMTTETGSIDIASLLFMTSLMKSVQALTLPTFCRFPFIVNSFLFLVLFSPI